jgi:hypothetical protein
VIAAREKHEPGTIVEPDLFAVETLDTSNVSIAV